MRISGYRAIIAFDPAMQMCGGEFVGPKQQGESCGRVGPDGSDLAEFLLAMGYEVQSDEVYTVLVGSMHSGAGQGDWDQLGSG